MTARPSPFLRPGQEAAMTDYYAALGASPRDSAAVIKGRYRALVKQFHPDRASGKAEAERRTREINEAWEVLGDEGKRAAYDAKRGEAPPGRETKSGKAPVGKADYENLTGKFDAFFGKAAAVPANREKQKNPLDAEGLFEKFMGFKPK